LDPLRFVTVHHSLQGFYRKAVRPWFGLGSVFQKRGCCGGDADVSAFAPYADSPANVIDALVFFDAVLGPFGVEDELLALFLGAGDGDKVRAAAAAVDDFVGDSLVGEFEMARGRGEGGVQDRVFDQGVGHRATLDDRSIGAAGFAGSAWRFSTVRLVNGDSILMHMVVSIPLSTFVHCERKEGAKGGDVRSWMGRSPEARAELPLLQLRPRELTGRLAVEVSVSAAVTLNGREQLIVHRFDVADHFVRCAVLNAC
jgi:hypothetical protein